MFPLEEVGEGFNFLFLLVLLVGVDFLLLPFFFCGMASSKSSLSEEVAKSLSSSSSLLSLSETKASDSESSSSCFRFLPFDFCPPLACLEVFFGIL